MGGKKTTQRGGGERERLCSGNIWNKSSGWPDLLLPRLAYRRLQKTHNRFGSFRISEPQKTPEGFGHTEFKLFKDTPICFIPTISGNPRI